jgi:inhibitor of cysteine peptidase
MVKILITETESERTVSAAVGDMLTIGLPENPTTGFRWQVASVDAGVLSLQADDFLQRASTAVGSGGVRIFRFLTVNPGSTDVRLELKRTWEALPPTSTFTTRVSVK